MKHTRLSFAILMLSSVGGAMELPVEPDSSKKLSVPAVLESAEPVDFLKHQLISIDNEIFQYVEKIGKLYAQYRDACGVYELLCENIPLESNEKKSDLVNALEESIAHDEKKLNQIQYTILAKKIASLEKGLLSKDHSEKLALLNQQWNNLVARESRVANLDKKSAPSLSEIYSTGKKTLEKHYQDLPTDYQGFESLLQTYQRHVENQKEISELNNQLANMAEALKKLGLTLPTIPAADEKKLAKAEVLEEDDDDDLDQAYFPGEDLEETEYIDPEGDDDLDRCVSNLKSRIAQKTSELDLLKPSKESMEEIHKELEITLGAAYKKCQSIQGLPVLVFSEAADFHANLTQIDAIVGKISQYTSTWAQMDQSVTLKDRQGGIIVKVSENGAIEGTEMAERQLFDLDKTLSEDELKAIRVCSQTLHTMFQQNNFTWGELRAKCLDFRRQYQEIGQRISDAVVQQFGYYLSNLSTKEINVFKKFYPKGYTALIKNEAFHQLVSSESKQKIYFLKAIFEDRNMCNALGGVNTCLERHPIQVVELRMALKTISDSLNLMAENVNASNKRLQSHRFQQQVAQHLNKVQEVNELKALLTCYQGAITGLRQSITQANKAHNPNPELKLEGGERLSRQNSQEVINPTSSQEGKKEIGVSPITPATQHADELASLIETYSLVQGDRSAATQCVKNVADLIDSQTSADLRGYIKTYRELSKELEPGISDILKDTKTGIMNLPNCQKIIAPDGGAAQLDQSFTQILTVLDAVDTQRATHQLGPRAQPSQLGGRAQPTGYGAALVMGGAVAVVAGGYKVGQWFGNWAAKKVKTAPAKSWWHSVFQTPEQAKRSAWALTATVSIAIGVGAKLILGGSKAAPAA